jgi:hypothetical protein
MIKFVGVSPEDFFFVQGFISEKGVTPVPVIRVRGGYNQEKMAASRSARRGKMKLWPLLYPAREKGTK